MKKDKVDSILEQWEEARPDLDCSAMGVVGRLKKVHHLWGKKLNERFKTHGMSAVEFDIMATLRRSQEPVTPTALYQTLMLSSGAMSTRLESLVEREMIFRLASPHDRRSCKVALTEKGQAAIDTALEGHVSNLDDMLHGLNKKEQTQLAELLKKVLLQTEL
jgi:DNA-binding MarR family transcriptional regulator